MNMPCRRSGLTLVEMLVVISITSVMLSLVTFWIGQTMRFSIQLRNHERQQLQLARLARSLRDDVRLSQSMRIEDGQRLVIESGPQWQIVYTISETEIQVEKHTGNQIRYDRFRLSSYSQPVWDTDQMPETIGLVIERRLDQVEQPTKYNPIDIHIFASIHRYPVDFISGNQE